MTEWQFPVAISTDNQHSLQRLIRAISLAKGQFSLILVRCNYKHLKDEILITLRSLTKDINLRELSLAASTTTLHSAIFAELFLDIPAVATDSLPSALMVSNLESVIALEDLLTSFNQARDIYADKFPLPLVLWLKDEVATLLSRLAPDFKSWAATTIKFEMTKEDLITLIRQETEALLSKVLAAGVETFLSNAALNLDPKSQHRREIESARHDLLRLYDIILEPELEASLEFVLGRDCYANDQIDDALAHYQQSLSLWQGELKMGAKSHHPDFFSSFLNQAIVFFHLGLCYRRLADLRPALGKTYWQDALAWFKKCLEVLEAVNRQDLVAKFILPTCEMLQRLQAWEDLQQMVCKSLDLHQKYGTQGQVAQDYGFLAAVAASKSDWKLAYELASKALTLAEEAMDIGRQQESWFLLLLGRIQRHLGEWEEAINHLEWAKIVCELQYEPVLYLEILEELRSLYFFERRDYLAAFNLKQEKIQIGHQYGFRAFIGASQLQPQRYRINPFVAPQTAQFPPEEVAQEIENSGRQQDVHRLIERIARADCKLTIVHGPSGVGKSSIFKAGLVPALKKRVIGERIPLTIVLSVYTDWLVTTSHLINQVVPTEVSMILDNSLSIIEKLKLLAERNYIIVLIFDQFEEFFFVSHDFLSRIKFYKFISKCLNIPFVKVILSLREDYLHYLLELERLSYENERVYELGVINKNILDKDIRYYLDKFSTQDALSIINCLTKRSHYEAQSDLVAQLVQDLAGTMNKVHPIELQIVGAQLQTENITTLTQYNQCGGLQKLVLRWLEEVIKDCGEENEKFAWQILFELTDEKGTRPLKTKTDLLVVLAREGELSGLEENEEGRWKELQATAFASGHQQTLELSPSPLKLQLLELILEILVGSGLILRVRDDPGDRYQLVHDYLVEPIRQKNHNGIVAKLEKIRLEKTKAEVAQKLSQEQLNLVLQQRLREARVVGTVLTVMVTAIGGLFWQANAQKKAAIHQTIRAEQSEANLKISVLTAASEALFASNKEFDALVESLRAFRRLETVKEVRPDTRMRVITALQQAVYGVTEINRLEGHSDIVWGVSFSPNGQLLASGSTDRSVKLWHPTGVLLQTLNGHSDAVTSVSFSPNGQTLASASLDKKVQIWRKDPITGKFEPRPYMTLSGHEDWIYSVNFSPDGELLVSGGKDGTIRLWRKNGDLVGVLKGHDGWVNWVIFSPDSRYIASASDDKTIKIWRRDGSLVKTLLGHHKGVTSVAFSPDGQILASGGRDKTVKLWRRQRIVTGDRFSFHLHKTLDKHTSTIWSLSFSSDSQQLASAGDDNTIHIWNRRGTLLKSFRGHNDAVANVAFSPNNKLLVSASYDKTVKLWSLNAPRLPILRGHEDRVLSVAWSADGKMLASGSRDHTVKLWQRFLTHTGVETRLYKTLRGHTERVTSVSFDPKGKVLASASYDKTVKLWRHDGSLVKTLRGHKDGVIGVSFSPDGQLLASASKDKTIKLWNREGKLLKTLLGHQGWVNSVSFSPDGQVLASASDDQTVKLWHQDGTLLKTFSPHESWVLGVSFSPTDNLLASASWDNTVKLWQWDGTVLKTLLRGYSDSVNAVTFSPNGEILAAASWDGTVKLWSREGKLIKTLNGHQAPVLSVSFSPDGQTLASASDDNTVILWNLDLDDLLVLGCSWVKDYLLYNRNVERGDRSLCDAVIQPEVDLQKLDKKT